MKGFLEKLPKILLILLLILIPTQLGKHFWFEWSYLLGIRIDYLSPTLYLIDFVWLGLFILNLIKSSVSTSSTSPLKKETFLKFKYLVILGFVGVNILMAKDWQVAGYKWFRIWQLIWFIWYVAKRKKVVEKLLIYIVPCWIIVESLLAVGQISSGGSLNGIWWWLGERSFSFNTIGIAQMSIAGNGLIRAYGTFSHPNSLAGFLLVSLILWWRTKPTLPSLENGGLRNVYWWGVSWLGLAGIILTGSRTIWILTFVLVIFGFFRNLKNKRIFWFGGGIVVLITLMIWIINFNYPIGNFLGGWDENGWIKRSQLNMAALEMIKKSPLVGVGMGNFLVNLPEFQQNNQIFWLQPVHNILLLLASEIGLLGLGIVVWVINNFLKNKKIEKNWLLIFGVKLVSGMVDHYWLTLPQNMWLLALILGIV